MSTVQSIGLTTEMIVGLSLTAGALLVALGLSVLFDVTYREYAKNPPRRLDLPISLWGASPERVREAMLERARDSWWIFGGVAVSLAVIWPLALIPYDTTYYQTFEVAGTVASVSDQFVSGSGSASYGQRVVTLDGLNQVFVVENPRILAFGPGDDITLSCDVSWVFRNADKWSCEIREPRS